MGLTISMLDGEFPGDSSWQFPASAGLKNPVGFVTAGNAFADTIDVVSFSDAGPEQIDYAILEVGDVLGLNVRITGLTGPVTLSQLIVPTFQLFDFDTQMPDPTFPDPVQVTAFDINPAISVVVRYVFNSAGYTPAHYTGIFVIAMTTANGNAIIKYVSLDLFIGIVP